MILEKPVDKHVKNLAFSESCGQNGHYIYTVKEMAN